jgi:uncharacterized protein YqcC (DUF446 family)
MYTEVAEVLIDIEAQLRQVGLWGKVPPSSQGLATTDLVEASLRVDEILSQDL